MNRRDLLKAGALALPLISAAKAQEIQRRSNGLPPLTIKDVKVITTNGGSRYHWVFLKIITSEPGLYGIGFAISTKRWRRRILSVQSAMAARTTRTG